MKRGRRNKLVVSSIVIVAILLAGILTYNYSYKTESVGMSPDNSNTLNYKIRTSFFEGEDYNKSHFVPGEIILIIWSISSFVALFFPFFVWCILNKNQKLLK